MPVALSEACVFPGITIRAAGESSSAANRRGGPAAGGTHASGGNGTEEYVNPIGNIKPEHQVLQLGRATIRVLNVMSEVQVLCRGG